MQKPVNVAWTRKNAISVHDKRIEYFIQQYGQAQTDRYFTSEFLYGRRQIDVHFSRLLADLPPHARVLDVGCGTGEQLERLLKREFDACGVEPSDSMRIYAQSKLPYGTITNGSVLDLPFEDETFDFVYAVEVFRYLTGDDNRQGLREIHRVLKSRGVFFGTFVNLYGLDGFRILVGVRGLIERWFHKPQECHTEFETPESLEQMLRSVGFSNVEIHGAMVASLRIAYKLGRRAGVLLARLLDPIDAILSDAPVLRRYSGHLIGIAWR